MTMTMTTTTPAVGRGGSRPEAPLVGAAPVRAALAATARAACCALALAAPLVLLPVDVAFAAPKAGADKASADKGKSGKGKAAKKDSGELTLWPWDLELTREGAVQVIASSKSNARTAVDVGDLVIDTQERENNREATWFLVTTVDGKTGWVPTTSLRPVEKTAVPPGYVREVIQADVVYEKPGGHATVRDKIAVGQRLQQTGETLGSWVPVKASEGVTGWVRVSSLSQAIPPDAPVEKGPPQAEVKFIDGTVFVTPAQGERVDAALGMKLIEGALVEVGPNSSAQLGFPNGTLMAMGQGSRLVINRLLWADPDSPKLDLKAKFKLFAGRVITAVRKKLEPSESLEIEAVNASAGVRGTEFRTVVEQRPNSAGSARFEVIESTIALAAAGQETSVPENTGARSEIGAPKPQVKQLPDAPLPLNLRPLAPLRSLELEWTRVTGAIAYRIEISKDPEGQQVVLSEVVQGLMYAPATVSLPMGTLYWRVMTVDADGFESKPSDAGVFELEL
jgi:hypothetical protein